MKRIAGVVKTLQTHDDGTLRVVIPKEIREGLKIQSGDKILVSWDGVKSFSMEKVK